MSALPILTPNPLDGLLQTADTAANPEKARDRLIWIDLARTIALGGMIVFHFFRDLEIFGLLARGTTVTGGWSVFSSVVAGSFLVIAGISFWLAHGGGMRWQSFLRRFVVLCAAAGLVSAATYVVFPGTFIRFGILHCIALSSVLGIVCLRLPALVVLALSLMIFAVPDSFQSDKFNAHTLLWVGLSTATPPALDYIPLLPWSGCFLFGLGAAKLVRLDLLSSVDKGLAPLGKSMPYLAWPGKHSLPIYLLHQPILLGFIWSVTRIAA